MFKCNNYKLVNQILNMLLLNSLAILRKELLKYIILLFSKYMYNEVYKNNSKKQSLNFFQLMFS